MSHPSGSWELVARFKSEIYDEREREKEMILTYDGVNPHGQLSPENNRVLPAATKRINNATD